MLTQRDNDFLRYWEANRHRRKKVFRQFLIGIPIGLLFVIPIVINFSSGWYKRADIEAHSADFNPMVLLVALLLIVAFTAIFYQRHKWDQYEQHYQELLNRRLREELPPSPAEPASGHPSEPTSIHPADPTSIQPADQTSIHPADPTSIQPADQTSISPASPAGDTPADDKTLLSTDPEGRPT